MAFCAVSDFTTSPGQNFAQSGSRQEEGDARLREPLPFRAKKCREREQRGADRDVFHRCDWFTFTDDKRECAD